MHAVAAASVNGPRCDACEKGYHRECTGGTCDCAICRVYRPSPDATAPAHITVRRPALELYTGPRIGPRSRRRPGGRR